jgi:predicted RecA/RadA family phage recombinase
MATNQVFKPGWQLSVVVSHPTTPTSGAPVRYGTLVGIALTDEGEGGNTATQTTVDFGPGIWDLTVDDNLGTGIAVGDALYYHDTGTGTGSVNVNNDPTGAQAFFGYAMETVSANATTEIQVMKALPSRNGKLTRAVIAGGSAGNLTVTGITQKDELVAVLRLDIDATAANTDLDDLTAEFSITAADTINNTGGTASTGDKLLVLYIDRSVS